jgi:hypothetical protein
MTLGKVLHVLKASAMTTQTSKASEEAQLRQRIAQWYVTEQCANAKRRGAWHRSKPQQHA